MSYGRHPLQSATTEIRRGKKKKEEEERRRRKKKKKLQVENIMSASAMQDGRKHRTKTWVDTYEVCTEMQPVIIKWPTGCSMPHNTTSL